MTPDDHITDEQVRASSGTDYRMTPGLPRATCLRCGTEYESYYAAQAHDCRINLGERKLYAEWLIFFQRLGYGVLKRPHDRKFDWTKTISGRRALTFHLQSDLFIGPGYELIDWYSEEIWRLSNWPQGVPAKLEVASSAASPREHTPEFEKQAMPGLDRHRN